MPTDDRGRLNDRKRAGPPGPETAKEDPEAAIAGSDNEAPPGDEGCKLLAQGEVLKDEVAARPKSEAHRREKRSDRRGRQAHE